MREEGGGMKILFQDFYIFFFKKNDALVIP